MKKQASVYFTTRYEGIDPFELKNVAVRPEIVFTE